MIRIGSEAARRNPERGHEVDVEHGLELLVRHLLDRRVPGVAGIVDDDVEPAERIGGGLDEAIGKARFGDAAVDRDGFAARRLDLVSHGVARRGIEVVDDDARPFAGEFQGDGPSDAAARSGDQGDLSLELGHLEILLVLDGDDGFAGKFDVAVLVPGCQRKFRAALAIVFDELGDMALAGQARTELGDGDEAGCKAAQPRGRDRVGQCLAEAGHHEHAVREDIGISGGPGEIQIDVNRIVIPRRAAIERELVTADRREFLVHDAVADRELTVRKSRSCGHLVQHHDRARAVRDVDPVLVGDPGFDRRPASWRRPSCR
jgi:hypothetical protein